jgi:hypothetical protein
MQRPLSKLQHVKVTRRVDAMKGEEKEEEEA